MYKTNLPNLNLKHNNKHSNCNNQFVFTYYNQVFNQIKIKSIINGKSSQIFIIFFYISRSFKYPKTLGRKIFNYNTFSKNSSSGSSYIHVIIIIQNINI